MSCPDWRRLDAAARDADAWPESVLRHLDSGCPRCWQEAVAVDPALIFRRLPAPELAPAQEAEEVEAARLAVAAMRAASRATSARRPLWGTPLPALRLPDLRQWLGSHPARPHAARWSLAAGLTAMALVVGSAHGWHAPAGSRPAPAISSSRSLTAAELPEAVAALPGSRGVRGIPGGQPDAARPPAWLAGAATDTVPASSRSSIEGLSRPRARVYQLDGPHMSVVMIVDDKLDV
jgi:hypothetical protein